MKKKCEKRSGWSIFWCIVRRFFLLVFTIVVIAVVAFAAIQAVYWLNLDNKIMFLLYKIFNKITDKVPRDRRF